MEYLDGTNNVSLNGPGNSLNAKSKKANDISKFLEFSNESHKPVGIITENNSSSKNGLGNVRLPIIVSPR
jgi:hypothetical protein